MADTRILNPQQLSAITHGLGPLLIIAGAGTGKTTVVTERIKHLILEKKVLPTQILALTFTEKAAREMEERIDVVMPYGYTQMWISTFHAFCDRILRNEAIHIGLTPSYKLMAEAQSILFLRKNLFTFKLNYFRPLGNPYKFLEGMLQHFSRLADEDISPDEYLRYSQEMSNDKLQITNKDTETLSAEKSEIEKTLELAHAYKTYEELKIKEGVMDYADLITQTLKLFRTRKNILKNYQEQFEFVLVDEFQDTNYAQNRLAILLSGNKKNITVVGDDDQAVYRWRGAAVSNMIQFKKEFKEAKIVTLTHNYRSSQEILDTAYKLIQNNNPDRLEVKENIDKKLITQRKVKKSHVSFLYSNRVEDEAESVVKKIQELVEKDKRSYKDFAILIRANDHSQPFVRSLQRNNIPFQFLGPGRLFRQEEIKDLIAYLKVLYNYEDSSSLYRVLTNTIFAIDPRFIATLLIYGRKKNLTLFETIEKIALETEVTDLFVSEDTKEKLKKVHSMIKNHLARVPKDTAGQILYFFLEDSGLLNKFLTAKNDTDVVQYQNIAKFFDKLKSFEAENEDASVFAVIEWIDLAMQMGESPAANDTDWNDTNAVNILTIHSSKGLEFPVVFVVNVVSQRFPTRERKEQIPIPQELIKEILPVGDYHLQEERRLFYVAVTRARDELYITAANFYGEGKRERKLSPFIADALGEAAVNESIGKQKAIRTVIQPSLLDWAEGFSEEKKSIHTYTNEQKPKTNIAYLSYSQIQTFSFCPLHYKLQYILRMPSQQTAAQSFGVNIHNALKDFYDASLRGEIVKTNDIEFMLKNRWITDGFKGKAHAKEAFERAVYLLKRYLDKNFIHQNKTIAVETPFQFFINTNSLQSLKIGGRIDRVDKIDSNTIEIVDYKTGSNVPTEKELEKNLQLTIYALSATKIHDKIFNKTPEQIRLSLHYIEEDKILTTTRTQEQLISAEEELFTKSQEIAQSDFKCSGSALCINCEYKMICAA